MKKIVRLTENDLIKIVKRVIKENEDFRGNTVFEDIMNEIEKMYDDITYSESIDELEMIERDLIHMYREIDMSKNLSDKEKNELDNNLNDCYGLIDDMYSKFSEEEDYESWSGRSSDDELFESDPDDDEEDLTDYVERDLDYSDSIFYDEEDEENYL